VTPQKLTDYVKVYEGHFPEDLCKAAIKEFEKIHWEKHQFYVSTTNQFVSYDNELSISQDYIFKKDEINSLIWKAIERYILKDFASFDKWFNGWEGHTDVRFNRYDPTTKMKIHCDHIQSMFDGQRRGIPTLTVLGLFNDDFEGGEFLMFEDQKIDLKAGSVMVFPSNFLYPHEVKPVTSGVRYSCVSWTW